MDTIRRPGILRANAYYLLAGAGLVLLGIAAPLIAALLREFGINVSQTNLMLVLNIVYYLPCMVLPVCIHALRNNGSGLRSAPLNGGQVVLCGVLAVLCVLMASAIGGLWTLLLEKIGLTLYSTDVEMNTFPEFLMGLFSMAIMPAVCEELVFRGTVLSAYERCGARKAIIISAIMFATLHGSVQGLPAHFIMGIVLGCVVCFTGSIYSGMLVHGFYNGIILLINYYYSAEMESAMETSEMLLDEINGLSLDLIISIVMVGVWLVEFFIVGALVWILLKNFADRGRKAGIIQPQSRKITMDGTTIAVLISGIITVGYLYLEDILLLMGYE